MKRTRVPPEKKRGISFFQHLYSPLEDKSNFYVPISTFFHTDIEGQPSPELQFHNFSANRKLEFTRAPGWGKAAGDQFC